MVNRTLRRVIGTNIKMRRQLFQYTQEHVALEAGISQTALSKVEAGLVDVKLEAAVRIARLFNCTAEDFVTPTSVYTMPDRNKARKAAG